MLFFFVLLLVHNGQPKLQINKCCPIHQHLKGKACVNNAANWDNIEEPHWYPTGIMYNTANYQLLNEVPVFDQYDITLGSKPNCTELSFLHSTRSGKTQFVFLSSSEGIVSVYVARDLTPRPVGAFQNLIQNIDRRYDKLFPLDGNVCMDQGDKKGKELLLVCPCLYHKCVLKCCPRDHYYHASNHSCLSLAKEKGPGFVWQNTSHKGVWRPPIRYGTAEEFYILPDTLPSCTNRFLLQQVKKDQTRCDAQDAGKLNQHHILRNGSVKIKKYNEPINNTHYCGETTIDEDGNIFHQNLFYCSESKTEEENRFKRLLYGGLMIFGGITLFLTVIISLYLPELRRRVHNKIAICHNTSLMVAYFAWSWTMLTVKGYVIFCVVLTLLLQFAFVSSFFWLNVMCFDICLVFSKTRSIGSSSGDRKKMIYYSAYAWGAAGIFSIFTLIMEYAPGVPDLYYPGMECNCTFDNDTYAVLIYLYGPIAFVLILNLILFIKTASKILSVQKQTAILHKKDSTMTGGSSSHNDKQRLIMYSKLFLLMGLSWVMEIISWMVGGSAYYWILTDVINILRAVFIFIIFVCKKAVWLSLKRKLIGRKQSTVSGSSRSEALSFSVSRRSDERRKMSREEVEMKKLTLARQVSEVPDCHHLNNSLI